MRVAILIERDRRCGDLRHCDGVTLIDVDDQRRTIVGCRDAAPPQRPSGSLPRWLAERGVGLVIAGVMDDAARLALRRSGIVILADAPPWPPERLVQAYLLQGVAPGAGA